MHYIEQVLEKFQLTLPLTCVAAGGTHWVWERIMFREEYFTTGIIEELWAASTFHQISWRPFFEAWENQKALLFLTKAFTCRVEFICFHNGSFQYTNIWLLTMCLSPVLSTSASILVHKDLFLFVKYAHHFLYAHLTPESHWCNIWLTCGRCFQWVHKGPTNVLVDCCYYEPVLSAVRFWENMFQLEEWPLLKICWAKWMARADGFNDEVFFCSDVA